MGTAQVVAYYDIISNQFVAGEVDPSIPRYSKMRPDLEAPANGPIFDGFTVDGLPILVTPAVPLVSPRRAAPPPNAWV